MPIMHRFYNWGSGAKVHTRVRPYSIDLCKSGAISHNPVRATTSLGLSVVRLRSSHMAAIQVMLVSQPPWLVVQPAEFVRIFTGSGS